MRVVRAGAPALGRRLDAGGSSLRSRRRGADLFAVLILAAVALAFFSPVLFGPYSLPAGGGDLASFLYPTYRFIAQSLSVGDLPLWNPHQYAGAPLAADNQSGLLYPPHLALFLMWPRFPYAALEWSVAIHVLWAGIGMYVLLRSWRISNPIVRPAAVLGGIAWMLSDGFVTHIGNLNYNAVAAWMPWALLGLHRAIEAGRARDVVGSGPKSLGSSGTGSKWSRALWWRLLWPGSRWTPVQWAILGGAAVGVGSLAGHAQVTFFTAALLGFYALWRIVADNSPKPALALGIVGVVGIGIAAPMILPTLALRPHTVRAAYDYATSVEYSLPWTALIGLFSPGVFGRGPGGFDGWWDRVEVGYVGVITLMLAAYAVSSTVRCVLGKVRYAIDRYAYKRSVPDRAWPRPDARIGFLIVLAILSLAMALGDATPLHKLILGPLHLPFRAPARFVLVFDLAVAMLAAIGASALMERARPPVVQWRGGFFKLTALFGIVSIGWLALAFSFLVGYQIMGATGHPARYTDTEWRAIANSLPRVYRSMVRAYPSLAALGLGSLGLIWLRSIGRLKASNFALLSVLLLSLDLIWLGAGTEIDRADPVDGYRRDVAAAWLAEHAGLARIDGAFGAWQPSAAQVHGLYDIGGLYNPLRLGLFSFYTDGLERRGSAVYNLLGTRYIVTGKGEARSDAEFITLAYSDDPAVDVWENARALPRVLLPTEIIPAMSDLDAFNALREPGFDPSRSIVLSGDEAFVANQDSLGSDPVLTDVSEGFEPAGMAEIVTYAADALSIQVELTEPAWLLLTDIYAPGWSATIDGAPAKIVRADFAFRSVRVPAGVHRIEMQYLPPGWRAGLIWALLTVLACGVAWGMATWSRAAQA